MKNLSKIGNHSKQKRPRHNRFLFRPIKYLFPYSAILPKSHMQQIFELEEEIDYTLDTFVKIVDIDIPILDVDIKKNNKLDTERDKWEIYHELKQKKWKKNSYKLCKLKTDISKLLFTQKHYGGELHRFTRKF